MNIWKIESLLGGALAKHGPVTAACRAACSGSAGIEQLAGILAELCPLVVVLPYVLPVRVGFSLGASRI